MDSACSLLRKILWAFLVVACASYSQQPARIEFGVSPAADRFQPQDPLPTLRRVELFAARNEYESFQIVLRCSERHLTALSAQASALKDDKGNSIPADNLTLFREQYVYLRSPSPKSSASPGLYPDALVPLVDPYTGKDIPPLHYVKKRIGVGQYERSLVGARFDGAPFDLWPGQNQILWVDVFVTKATPAGTYRGRIDILLDGRKHLTVPVSMTVWDFQLPDGPAAGTHFGDFHTAMRYHGLKEGDPAYEETYLRYCHELADHRLDPPAPEFLLPKAKEDGSLDFAEKEQKLRQYLEETHLRHFQIPEWPFADPLGKDRERTLRYLKSYYEFLQRNNWAEGAYLYVFDEPDSREDYERIIQLAQLVHEAQPKLKFLLTEQTWPQEPDWPKLSGQVDIWCPLFGLFDEQSARQAIDRGEEVWAYTALCQGPFPDHPQARQNAGKEPLFWQMDFPLLNYRLPLWIGYRFGITGLLYWSTVHWGSPDGRDPWTDAAFRNQFNGEGYLFYPGTAAGIDGPVTSMRLKNLRDGMEDYEYLVLLQSLGEESFARTTAKQIGASWYEWTRDAAQLFAARRTMAERIVATLKRR